MGVAHDAGGVPGKLPHPRIVDSLNEFIPEADLVPLREIDRELAEIDDWQVLLALYHHDAEWDGLITNDSQMLNLPREMAALRQTNLTLVVAHDSGHDPIKATGLLFTHLSWICRQTTPDSAQVWSLVARNRMATDPWEHLERIADHRSIDVEELWQESRLTTKQLAEDPLAL